MSRRYGDEVNVASNISQHFKMDTKGKNGPIFHTVNITKMMYFMVFDAYSIIEMRKFIIDNSPEDKDLITSSAFNVEKSKVFTSNYVKSPSKSATLFDKFLKAAGFKPAPSDTTIKYIDLNDPKNVKIITKYAKYFMELEKIHAYQKRYLTVFDIVDKKVFKNNVVSTKYSNLFNYNVNISAESLINNMLEPFDWYINAQKSAHDTSSKYTEIVVISNYGTSKDRTYSNYISQKTKFSSLCAIHELNHYSKDTMSPDVVFRAKTVSYSGTDDYTFRMKINKEIENDIFDVGIQHLMFFAMLNVDEAPLNSYSHYNKNLKDLYSRYSETMDSTDFQKFITSRPVPNVKLADLMSINKDLASDNFALLSSMIFPYIQAYCQIDKNKLYQTPVSSKFAPMFDMFQSITACRNMITYNMKLQIPKFIAEIFQRYDINDYVTIDDAREFRRRITTIYKISMM